MTITYIYHSCFTIEINDITIVFDYFKDEKNIINPIIERSKKLYVLSSHRHPDHFSKDIFDWKDKCNDIHFILSNDINKKLKNRYSSDACITFIKEGETTDFNDISIRAFGSTDIGISFLVEVAGQRIFHAGDLNNWHWRDESTDEEVEKADKNFLGKLKAIKKYTQLIDVAFFPVDPRMGRDFAKGANQFVTQFKISNFIPMHFWDMPEDACNFSTYRNPDFGNYICLDREGSNITI